VTGRIGLVFGVLTAAAIVFSCASQDESAQPGSPGTGSRLGNDAINRTVLTVNEDSMVGRVQKLLAENRVDEAMALAEENVASLESRQYVGVNRSRQRYDALNISCIALTKGHRLDDALARCTEAVELLPEQWSAFSNRGTVLFVKGDYVAALEDYRQARELVHDRDDQLTVQHNIELAEERVRETRSDPN